MASSLIDSLFGLSKPLTRLEFMDNSAFDELIEIDVISNRCTNLYHVSGKYFVPADESSFKHQYQYALDNMVHPEDRSLYAAFMEPSSVYDRVVDSETPGMLGEQFRYRLRDGGWRWVEQVLVAGPVHGLPDGIIRCYVFDIDNQVKRSQGVLVNRGYSVSENRDSITGLLGRTSFFAQAEEFLSAGGNEDWCLAVIDIEHFRFFNEWHGRDAGNALLEEMGAKLIEFKAGTGLAGYLGQDDFCLIVPYDESRFNTLFEELRDLIVEHGAHSGFSPAIGICLNDGESELLDLFDRASLASRRAKEDFRHRICVYEPMMGQRSEAEYRILSEFHDALANDEFFFVLQPQCKAATGKIVGVEALVRWRKPSGEVVPPLDFIPVLEKYGFITDLDCYVWEDACRSLREWSDAGNLAVPCSVNVSVKDIYAIDVASVFENLVQKYSLSHDLLKIEITESAYADDTDKVRNTVADLRDKGFVVLMDDFGSGYSSLNMLNSLNVDVIKLDARFLQLGENDALRGMHIIESIVNMAKTMGLPIIAEGVETKQQVEYLEGIGCNYMQGYYFYRPLEKRDFEELIRSSDLIEPEGFVTIANEQFRIREFLDQNVYSDAMLNGILGPVALYSVRGEDVDIIRFNEQFYKSVDVEDFNHRLENIQNYVPEGDRHKLYRLFKNAQEDPFNGATEIIRFYRTDGSIMWFLMHCYFLEDKGGDLRFYGSVRDITRRMRIQEQLNVLEQLTSSTVLFLKMIDGKPRLEVVIHGLENETGLSKERLQYELDERLFLERVDDAAAARMRENESGIEPLPDDMSIPARFRRDDGTVLNMRIYFKKALDEDGAPLHVAVFKCVDDDA